MQKNLSSKDKRLELIEDDLTGPDHEVNAPEYLQR